MIGNQPLIPPDNNASPEAVLDYYVFRRELIDFNQRHGETPDPKQFLAEHWQKIRKTPIVYTNTPAAPSTQFCLNLAEELCRIYPKDEKGADTNPYMFLMPGILNANELKDRTLSEIILTDDTRYGLVIDDCIFKINNGKPHYFNKRKNKNIALTKSEIHRIKYHSAEAEAYYDAVKVCSSGVSIGKALKALIHGLEWSIQYDCREPAIAAINTFQSFLEKLDPITYQKLMKKKGNWGSLAEIWDYLSKLPDPANEYYLRVCRRALVNLKKSYRNINFLEKTHPWLIFHASVQAFDIHDAYRAAVKAGTLKIADYQKLKRQLFLINLLPNDELKEIFTPPAMDRELAPLWENLTAAQKNQLAEVLDGERLLVMLQKQKDPKIELDDAITSLKKEIESNPHAEEVFKQICKSRDNAKPKDFPLLAELAHRTAVGVRNPKNESNLDRYPVVAAKLSERTWGQKVAAAAKVFFGMTLLGCAITSCILMPVSVALIIPALMGVCGLFVLGRETYHWKRPPHYRTTVAAMSFLNKTKCYAAFDSGNFPSEALINKKPTICP